MTLRRRVSQLEDAKPRGNLSAVIVQSEGQSLEDAISVAGIYPKEGEAWRFIVVPARLTEQQWSEKYSPKDRP